MIILLACSRQAGVMSWEQYSSLHVDWPYVATFDPAGSGELLYFGARHTYAPADPQLEMIESAWRTFRPDIALTEGGHPPIEKSCGEAVRKYGEPGFVRCLAARDDVPTTSLDPTLAEEVAALRTRFPRERIKLFFVLRGVSQYVQRSGTDGVDAETTRVLGFYADTPGLSGAPHTVSQVQAAYEVAFPGHGRYSSVRPGWFDPVRGDTFLNAISRASSDYRDTYVVRRLAAHLERGERVFAVMGGSHVVMQEPALRAMLKTRP
jgi:hypothetical protein